MEAIELIKGLCAFDTATLVISFSVAVLTGALSKFIKTKQLRALLPFILGVVICIIFRIFTEGVRLEISDISNGILTGSLSYVFTAVYFAFTDGKKISASPLTTAIEGALISYGVKDAYAIAEKLSLALSASNLTDNNTEEIIILVLSEELPEQTEDELIAISEVLKNLINSL